MRSTYGQLLALAACAAAGPIEKRQVFSPPVDFSTPAAPAPSAPAPSAPAGTGCTVSYVTSAPSASAPVAAPIASSPANSSIPAGSSAVAPPPTPSGPTGEAAAGGLHAAFVAAGKQYLGNIADPGTLADQGTIDILNADFGQITPENSQKWDATEPSQGAFNFDAADQTAAFAAENGKLLRCHALLWHSQLPAWVEAIGDPAELTSVIQTHIAEVAGHFAGQCFAWDVVNEIFDEDGTLRDSVFSRVLGEDFVRIAFEAARAADPDTKLYINDYNLDDATYPKVTGLTGKVSEWLAAGIPIDGIGTQSHLSSGHGGSQALLETLAATGVSEIAVTELDIGQGTGADYTEIVGACLNVPACVGVTVWGVTDGQSWRQGDAATLFNDDFTPKEAYTTLLGFLEGGA